MKFRGRMVEILCIQHFCRIVNTIARISKVGILRLTTDKLYFIVKDKGTAAGRCLLWCEMNQHNFFTEYAMTGVSTEYNEIYMELSIESLGRALKTSTQTAKSVKLKLTKKHTPCLTLEAELPSPGLHSRNVMHDIPATVLPRKIWCDYEEPEMPIYDVSLALPPLKILRNIVDRMKNLGSHVTLSASSDGSLTLKVESDMLEVQTHFKNLEVTAAAMSQLPWAEARVDIKKLQHLLSGQQMNPSKTVCNIVNNRIVHLFFLEDDASLQFLLPHIHP